MHFAGSVQSCRLRCPDLGFSNFFGHSASRARARRWGYKTKLLGAAGGAGGTPVVLLGRRSLHHDPRVEDL